MTPVNHHSVDWAPRDRSALSAVDAGRTPAADPAVAMAPETSSVTTMAEARMA
jgi:hypothetical protein